MHGEDIRTRKAVIIGAGRVGSHVALCLMFQHLVNEIVFLDVNKEGRARPGRSTSTTSPPASVTPSPSAWATTPTARTPTS